MIINEAGEYTLKYTATDACGNSTTVERDLVVTEPQIYGALWEGLNDSTLTRTQHSPNQESLKSTDALPMLGSRLMKLPSA